MIESTNLRAAFIPFYLRAMHQLFLVDDKNTIPCQPNRMLGSCYALKLLLYIRIRMHIA
jgi:hypothetical protein